MTDVIMLCQENKKEKYNMKSTKGIDFNTSQTKKNLEQGFSGESQARNKYTYFAAVAKKEGYHAIAKVFAETAENEVQHAKLWFKALGGINGTLDNLKAAAEGENHEWTDMYKEFAEIAKAEGFDELALRFQLVGAVERDHEARYATLAKMLENGTLFKRDKEIVWECMNCGHHHKGKEAPQICPTCVHPQGFFFADCDNYGVEGTPVKF